MRLKDRVAVVTGGGSGIGRAICRLFGEEGAVVVVNDVDLDAAEKTVAEIGSGHALRADVSRSDEVRAMFEEVDRRAGHLDILVNNAGIAEVRDERWTELNALIERGKIGQEKEALDALSRITVEMSDDDWRRMLAVHLDGTFFCTREALRIMLRQRRGSIVNVSSVAALHGQFFSPHYSAAKAGILGFTKALAQEVGSRGIRVNAVCPGLIETPMSAGFTDLLQQYVVMQTPVGRKGQPADIAHAALFLASDESAFITGHWISPNGGLYIAP